MSDSPFTATPYPPFPLNCPAPQVLPLINLTQAQAQADNAPGTTGVSHPFLMTGSPPLSSGTPPCFNQLLEFLPPAPSNLSCSRTLSPPPTSSPSQVLDPPSTSCSHPNPLNFLLQIFPLILILPLILIFKQYI